MPGLTDPVTGWYHRTGVSVSPVEIDPCLSPLSGYQLAGIEGRIGLESIEVYKLLAVDPVDLSVDCRGTSLHHARIGAKMQHAILRSSQVFTTKLRTMQQAVICLSSTKSAIDEYKLDHISPFFDTG